VTFDAYSREYVERRPRWASSMQVAEFGLGRARRVFGKRPIHTLKRISMTSPSATS
jgi:hypothetical protein